MDINNTEKFVLIVSAGLFGGFIGYIIGELIIERLYGEDYILEPISGDEEKLKEIKDKPKKVDYANYSTKKSKTELSKLVEPYKNEKKGDCFIITSDEFSSQPEYDKETIFWYEDDSVFTNSSEELLDNSGDLFIPNPHLHFGEGSEDPDVVFIRNDKMSVDYEIIRIHGSYAEIVLGEPPKQKTKPKRSRSRAKKATDEVTDNEDENEN